MCCLKCRGIEFQLAVGLEMKKACSVASLVRILGMYKVWVLLVE